MQEYAVRMALRDRPELEALASEYQQVINQRLKPLKAGQLTNVFGPKLESQRELTPQRLTNHVALPLFAPPIVSLSGLLVTNDQSHADLYAMGDIGYAWFVYQWDGSLEYARLVLYLRPDASFVPLKTEADFTTRLEWEKAKWLALQQWLDVHLPKATTKPRNRSSASNTN